MATGFIRVMTLPDYGLVAGMLPVDGVLYEVTIRRERIEGDLVRTDVLRTKLGVRHAKKLFSAYLEANYPHP